MFPVLSKIPICSFLFTFSQSNKERVALLLPTCVADAIRSCRRKTIVTSIAPASISRYLPSRRGLKNHVFSIIHDIASRYCTLYQIPTGRSLLAITYLTMADWSEIFEQRLQTMLQQDSNARNAERTATGHWSTDSRLDLGPTPTVPLPKAEARPKPSESDLTRAFFESIRKRSCSGGIGHESSNRQAVVSTIRDKDEAHILATPARHILGPASSPPVDIQQPVIEGLQGNEERSLGAGPEKETFDTQMLTDPFKNRELLEPGPRSTRRGNEVPHEHSG